MAFKRRWSLVVLLALVPAADVARAFDQPSETWRFLPADPVHGIPPGSPSLPFSISHTPLLIQLTDDDGDGIVTPADNPDIVVPVGQNPGHLVEVDSTGTFLGVNAAVEIGNLLAVGQLVPGGSAEIAALASAAGIHGLVVFNADRTVHHFGPMLPPFRNGDSTMAIADVNQDGSPEILMGPYLLSASGTLLHDFNTVGASGSGHPIAADIVSTSPGLEIVVCGKVHDSAGIFLWGPPTDFGHNTKAAVADFDADGRPDVLLAGRIGAGAGQVQLFASDGTPMGPRIVDANEFGQPTVADFDGDGRPEVFLPGKHHALLLEAGAAGLSIAWTIPTQEDSGYAGGAAFDFDGNGASEIVYHDEANNYLIDGATGTVLWFDPMASNTGWETPVIADLDGDCDAELLFTSGRTVFTSGPRQSFGSNQMRAYDVRNSRPARKVWNQQSYHVTNVGDDNAIPQFEQPSWLDDNSWVSQAEPDPVPLECRCHVDNTPPHFECCPADVMVSCTEVPEAETPVVTDDCDEKPVVELDEVVRPGPCVGEYVIVRTWQATDAADNVAICQQVVSVVDRTPPTLVGCPPPFVLTDCSEPHADSPTAVDDCDPAPVVTLTTETAPGDCGADAVLVRTWTARDECGNASSCNQTIVIRDAEGPVLTLTSDTACLWPPTGDYVCFTAEAFGALASDDCGGEVSYRFTSCASDQPDDAPEGTGPGCFNGDGSTQNDCVITGGPGGTAACVRSESAGHEPGGTQHGRTYRIGIVAVDACGNASAERFAIVTVAHDQSDPPPTGCLDPNVVGCSGNDGVPCRSHVRLFAVDPPVPGCP